jgi:hypothetical protein
MKKNIFIILFASLVLSCSNDGNCQENKDAINSKYDNQIQYVRDNPGIDGIDFRQIGLLNDERSIKLDQACK